MIIPLLDDKITLQDISTEAGFIDAYSADINRPYLCDNIFLLYSPKLNTEESIERNERFKSLSSLYNRYEIYINGNYLILYVFTINKAIKSIINDSLMLSKKDVMRIIAFWNLTDADINSYMLDPLYVMYNKFVEKVVPEEDYRPEFELQWNEKSGALQYRSAPL